MTSEGKKTKKPNTAPFSWVIACQTRHKRWKKNVRPEFTSQAITLEIAKISVSTGAHAQLFAWAFANLEGTVVLVNKIYFHFYLCHPVYYIIWVPKSLNLDYIDILQYILLYTTVYTKLKFEIWNYKQAIIYTTVFNIILILYYNMILIYKYPYIPYPVPNTGFIRGLN